MNSEPFVRVGIISVLLLTAELARAGSRRNLALRSPADSLESSVRPRPPESHSGSTAGRGCKRRFSSDLRQIFALHNRALRQSRWSSRQRNIREVPCVVGPD